MRDAFMDASCAVLIGGESRRMGSDKASTVLCGKTLLERVLEVVKPLFSEVIICGRDKARDLPAAAADCRLAVDELPGRGPALGIAAALSNASNEWVFVVSCDVPLLKPEVVEALYMQRDGFDVVVPELAGGLEPMCAFYSKTALLPLSRNVLQGRRSLIEFLDGGEARVRRVAESELRRVDPEFLSFMDVDTPEELMAMEKTLRTMDEDRK
jgi:molybdopterin-guanine dinucleotide biosynthesis protein A